MTATMTEAPVSTNGHTSSTKPVAKKTRKAKPAATKTEAQYGIDRSHDLPWHDKKVAIFKALKALGATKSGDAVSAVQVAAKAKVTARDVRHYCYHAKAAGLVDLATIEDVRGHAFYLTAKGRNIDPVQAQKAEQAE
jgi:biopolymer transport protein ExbD